MNGILKQNITLEKNERFKMIVDALRKKYEYEIISARANIDVYLRNPAGIGEHPDIVAAVDTEMEKLADAEDKLKTLNSNFKSSSLDILIVSSSRLLNDLTLLENTINLIKKLGINPESRPENLTVNEFLRLSKRGVKQ